MNTLPFPTEILRSCRHCGHPDSADLVEDLTIGSWPMTLCADISECRKRQGRGTALKPVIVSDLNTLTFAHQHVLAHAHDDTGQCIRNRFVAPTQCPVVFPDDTVVMFKEESDVDGEPVGPCGIVVSGQPTARPYDPDATSQWFRLEQARDLANRLGLPLRVV